MGLTTRSIQWVYCEACNTGGPETIEGAKEARELARKEGWTRRADGADLCPDHKNYTGPRVV